jgi:hypothetical protein
MTNQDVSVQITVIPAEPGWSMVFRGMKGLWYQPIVAWEVRSFTEARRVADVRPLTFDSMANSSASGCELLRDPQGILRTLCTAFESEVAFATEDEALAYLRLPHRARAGLEGTEGPAEACA